MAASSLGVVVNVISAPEVSRTTHRLYHCFRYSERRSIHRPDLSGPSSPTDVPDRPVARFIPGDMGGWYEGVRGASSSSWTGGT